MISAFFSVRGWICNGKHFKKAGEFYYLELNNIRNPVLLNEFNIIVSVHMLNHIFIKVPLMLNELISVNSCAIQVTMMIIFNTMCLSCNVVNMIE